MPDELGHVDGTYHQNETGENRVVQDGGSDELEAAQQAFEPLTVHHPGVDRVDIIKLVDQGDAAGQGEKVSELVLPPVVARMREPARKRAPSIRSPLCYFIQDFPLSPLSRKPVRRAPVAAMLPFEANTAYTPVLLPSYGNKQ